MYDHALDDLHAPLMPILHDVLALAPLPRAGLVLDLACGPGLKAPLIAKACGPGVQLLGVDIDRAAIRTATTNQRSPTTEDRGLESEDYKPETGDALSASLDSQNNRRSSAVGRQLSVVGDAHALPLGDGCCAAAVCIAALSLFADRQVALSELRRVLAPGGVALLVVGVQSWTQLVRWPADLAARLAVAYAQALADGIGPLPTTPDLGGDLASLLLDTGFATAHIRAFWLDRPTTNDQRPTTNDAAPIPHLPSPISHPLLAELPLLPWPALRLLLAGRLDAAELAHCDELAGEPEVELCALALVAQAYAP